MISAAIQQFLKEHPEARVLDLSLTYHWYDEIEAGRKKEEYRNLNSNYYWHRFHACGNQCPPGFDVGMCKACPRTYLHSYDYVLFHRGRFSPTAMLVQCDGIRIGYGREDWGAERGKRYFVIQLGDRII